jgi:hypothetical protein
MRHLFSFLMMVDRTGGGVSSCGVVPLVSPAFIQAFDWDWRRAGLSDFFKTAEHEASMREVMWEFYPDVVRIFQRFTAVKHPLKSNEVFCMRAAGCVFSPSPCLWVGLWVVGVTGAPPPVLARCVYADMVWCHLPSSQSAPGGNTCVPLCPARTACQASINIFPRCACVCCLQLRGCAPIR